MTFIIKPMINLILNSSDNLGNKIDFQELKQGTKPIVFLVNGFGGCAPCINRNLAQKLKLEPISVYDLDWNDIHLRRQSVYINFHATNFINDMVYKVIPVIPPERKIFLIGHSFGGDALLKIARQIMPRPITFLGILDGVKKFGQRTTISVPPNVQYFYNRWTKYPSLLGKMPELKIPGTNKRIGVAINAIQSGAILRDNPSTYNDQKEQSYGYDTGGFPILVTKNLSRKTQPQHQIITHSGKYAIYKDPYIQQQMFEIIKSISEGKI